MGDPTRVVIVGGGAGGLELAARLGRASRRHPERPFDVTLVDAALTHVWKPQLHELATGTLHGAEQEVDFLQQARRHGFRFHLGRLTGLDRTRRAVVLEPLVDDDGRPIAPLREITYDVLVVAVGSVVDDFGVPGVREHALTLDTAEDARRLHRRLLAAWGRAELQDGARVGIVVVGGGATGVEFVAELTEAAPELARYGRRLARDPQPVQVHLLEGSDRLVRALPEAMSRDIDASLRERGVDVRVSARVVGVDADGVALASGERIPADIVLGAAGIRGPEVLARLDGLELDRQGRLVAGATLQTTRDEHVYVLGDCGSVALENDTAVLPPRAQVAQQQAAWMADALCRRRDGKPVEPFRFDDKGSLVSLGRRDAVGQVRAPASRRSLDLHGLAARWAYWGLQRRHLVALHGVVSTALATVGSWLIRRAQPRVKLH